MAKAKRKWGAERPTLDQATSPRRIAAPISQQGTADLPGSRVSAVLTPESRAATTARSSSAAAAGDSRSIIVMLSIVPSGSEIRCYAI